MKNLARNGWLVGLFAIGVLGATVAACGSDEDDGTGGSGNAGATGSGATGNTGSGATGNTTGEGGTGNTGNTTGEGGTGNTTGEGGSGNTGGMATGGAGQGGSGNVGGGGNLDCTADPNGDPCEECIKANCCNQATACFADAECATCLACVQSAPDPFSCVTNMTCDLMDPVQQAFLTCGQQNCQQICQGM